MVITNYGDFEMQKNTDLSLAENQRPLKVFIDNLSESLPASVESEEYEEHSHLRKHLSFIHEMAQLTSSGITVFDIRRNIHIYTSRNFYHLFGYDIEESHNEVSNEIFDKKIHPEDLIELKINGYAAMQFLSTIPAGLRKQYKLVNEYRICTKEGGYIMVTEQHQILEQDSLRDTSMSLGMIDISPNQKLRQGVNFQIHNFLTGEFILIPKASPSGSIKLTTREQEILKMIRDGKLSKEIAGMLSISIHTVNTHRQRILEKLNVDNSIEAITKATRYGYIN